MRNFFFLFLVFIISTNTACTSGKASVYKPTGVSVAMMKMLTGSWEAVGLSVNNKTIVLGANEASELVFKNDKMLLNALGKKELTTYSVKDKMIINPAKPTERPMKIVSITRTELNLNFTATDGQLVDMTFLRKN